MPRSRGVLIACVLALALMAGAGGAAASPMAVYADFAEDHVIDGRHDTRDLLAALAAARGDVEYQAFADAVQDALDRTLIGGTSTRPGAASAERPAEGRTGGSPLPAPRSPDENGRPPWPLIALTALAAGLMLSGAGSSIYRRWRRGPAPGE